MFGKVRPLLMNGSTHLRVGMLQSVNTVRMAIGQTKKADAQGDGGGKAFRGGSDDCGRRERAAAWAVGTAGTAATAVTTITAAAAAGAKWDTYGRAGTATAGNVWYDAASTAITARRAATRGGPRRRGI